MKRMRAILFAASAMAMWPSTVLAQVPAPKQPVDPTPADPKPADPKPAERPSGPPQAEQGPTGPSQEVLDRVAALDKEATAIAKHRDWLTVANLLEQAYFLLPDPDLAYRIGEAAREVTNRADEPALA